MAWKKKNKDKNLAPATDKLFLPKKVRELDAQLQVMQKRHENAVQVSVDRFLRTLSLVGIDETVINNPTLIWMLEKWINRNIGKFPFYQEFPIKDWKIINEITDDLTMGFVIWLNLLETRNMNFPVPSFEIREIMIWLNKNYKNLKRKQPLMDAGAFDENGRIYVKALERSARDWLEISKGKKPF